MSDAGEEVAPPRTNEGGSLARANDDVALPRFVQIEPVGQCNLRCRMCPIQFRGEGGPGQPRAFMDFEVFCRLIDQFPQLEELQLQGLGEPMLHPRFFDMVRYAAGRGIAVSTNTNLTVLTDARAEECVASGLRTLHASLDGASADTFQAIRLRARFERVLRNLRRLVQAREKLRSATPDIRLVAVAMRRNLHELPDLVRLARREGVRALSVQHLCHDFGESSLPERYRPMRSFVDEESLVNDDPQRVERHFEAARAAARELGVALRLPNVRPRPHPPGMPGRARCDWPWRGAYISYDGRAMPCCMVSTPDRIHFGDMAQNGVATIWNNRQYTAFREQLASATPPEVCRSCAIYAGTF
ncbi:SPASM domain-containing protein [Noviherbaspirillum sp. UKPF54]|uniref:SPASM domain-containing protein n=1 Tax=Noviherbaspirillum sp. UKPF54 TaxID=2601898 RepID=UPI0011B141E2|nr:SPASM domain-containing protein [Noviherbaspirillum sp. UKPF54]QDZ27056.1 radical SAM protein [Noviherbaspirillum sp. UKPF54]